MSPPPAGAAPAPGPAGNPVAIALHGVRKTYREGGGEKEILRGVDLLVPRGELVILLGRSGSGKSTLLNLLAGIDQPDSGRVTIAGVDLQDLDDRARTLFRRRHLGFVFQFFNLIPTLTVEENVLLRLELTGRLTRGDRERARELLDAVGMSSRARSWPDRLSGGEQQRVAIAAALVHEPDLVLADEPTGNLDLETGRTVIELLDRLSRQTGRTLLMATHSRDVMGIADRVLTMGDGVLHEASPVP